MRIDQQTNVDLLEELRSNNFDDESKLHNCLQRIENQKQLINTVKTSMDDAKSEFDKFDEKDKKVKRFLAESESAMPGRISVDASGQSKSDNLKVKIKIIFVYFFYWNAHFNLGFNLEKKFRKNINIV